MINIRAPCYVEVLLLGIFPARESPLRPLRCGLAQGGNSQLHQDSSLGCKALQLTKSNGQRTSPFGNIDHFYQFLIHYTSSLRILLFVTAGQLRQHVLLPSDTVLIDGFPEFF